MVAKSNLELRPDLVNVSSEELSLRCEYWSKSQLGNKKDLAWGGELRSVKKIFKAPHCAKMDMLSYAF